ncbi:protein kinase C-binding protein 1-like isoform X1 [Pieris brassicae]|uniref:protein kinase C-binding protein 1-like isoform X1 n=1 Tax=Pieris brassicae TaxID=7116 RepID=UPI001E6618A7|nr:protein kinase C-binding protein 1-like isoform X1 [Pieris brassicae]XP_045530143.1 protein kinase C-binding protein 1-like isoform X1 [Pieris brassicae]
MEDTTDANRDTDVSSTTADVPEIQEISGSNGNVEMVVTIEKIETPEEDGNTTPPQSYAEGQETDATTMVSVEPSVVEKSPNSKESPHKINSTQKEAVTPRKETSSPKITVKSPITITPTKETDRIEVVTPTKTTPRKETIKIVINSPKDEKSQTLKTPTKVSDQIVDSSCKALSPYKELEKVIDLKETSGKEFGNEAQTVEEPPIATSSQDIAISTDTTNTKELINSCEVTAPNENQKEAVSLKPPIDICDKSNDSQLDANSDVSEKEHNKSISRELKSLIKSAKESKIISECTQLTSKTRKSRTPLELNTSVETEKITPRRNSNASMKSNHSEKSEKAVKRSMRSQNPEFVNKVKQFLNSVVGKNHDSDDDLNEAKKEFNEKSPSPKKRRIPESPLIKSDKKLRTDPYCWRCHWAIELGTNEKTRPPMQCTVCPRVYHYKCLSSNERKKIDMERSWVCPECLAILYAESSDTRSISLKHVSVSHLGELLQHALTRMIELNGVEPFMQPVDRALFPDYDKCVVHPMDLSQMQRNIVNGLYGSPEAFMSDAQWILHNSIIFNTLQSKLTLAARALVRLCRSEMGEIEACPECYAAAHNRRPTWFTDVCSKPHILLWAKLKGFPYWPAKGMSVTGSGVVDVRFFGAHDRAWVPAKDCFLYSEKDPNNVRSKKQIMDSMQEAEQYIRNISRKYGKFVYPPFKTPFEPTKINEQFKMMIPSFEGELRFQIKDKSGTASPKIKEKRRSNSKSSVVDGEASDNEEQDSSKATESTEENKLDAVEVEKPMDVEENKDKEKKVSRKRRRSEAEDYVIINDSTKEKRSRIEKEATTPKQPEKQTDKQKKVIEVRAKGEENEPEKVEEKKKEKIKQKDENNEVPNSTNSTKEIVVSVNSPKTPKPKAKDKSDKPRRTIERSAEKTEERKEKRLSRGKSLIVNNVSADKDKTARPKVRKVTKSTDVEILISKNMINKNLNKSLEKFKPSKERLHFDDDTTLAVLAREVSKTGMPTITSVRSLSEKRPRPGLIEVSVDANSNASVLTSEESAHSKDGDKSPKTRESEPPVGRVGVRAFARMQAENAPSSDIEIKPEPIDFDTDRQMEKLEVMNSFRLQPVNPPATKLREVRINKLVVTPINRKKPEIRVKAKKTFPQAKKPEGSELNSKNSMVYIPIQPASGQAPVRPNRPVANGVQVQVSASVATPTTTSPQTPSTTATVSQTTPTSISMGAVSNMASMAQGPSVHTVPLITSVNGQWAFSLQPVMSVGGVDSSNGPSVNGIERAGTLVAVPTPVSVSSMAQLNPQRKDDTQLPRLQHKPMLNPFDTSNSRPVPAPSTVGPLTAKLNHNASKLTDFFRTLMEETLEKVNEPAAHVTSLKLQLEQLQWKHRQELDELKHNHELAMVEMRTSLERDKNRAVNEERRTMHLNMEAAVKTAKSKQWCANCCQEAQFYCCWNTSYCDYPCQRAHWTTHAALCTQAQDSNGPDNSKDIHARLQPAPERLTPNKNPSKPTRVYTKEMPKTSLIGTPISMVEDSSGNQTVKCVGTYKPNAQAPPVIINKQLHSNEEAKKVTTSGGYLIVGGGSTVSTPRRPTIQYVHTS